MAQSSIKIGSNRKFIGLLFCVFLTLTFGIVLLDLHIMKSSTDPTTSSSWHTDNEPFQGEDSLVISFGIQFAKIKLDQPIIKCHMSENKSCNNFAWALVNREYQSGAKYLVSLPNTADNTTFFANGEITINSTLITSVVSYMITNLPKDKTWKLHTYYAMWNQEQEKFHCGELFWSPCLLSFHDLAKKVIYGRGGISGNFWNFPWPEEIDPEYEEWNMEERKLAVLDFEANRKLMCRCQEGGVLDASLNSTQLIQQCFKKLNIREKFRQLLNPPSCYGGLEAEQRSEL